METFIIDGYNLLRRGFGFGGGVRDLESQRSMMEVLLREFHRSHPDTRIVVVYDGALGLSRAAVTGRDEASTGFEVRFSTPPQTGDDLVLAEVEARRRAGRVTVVTSDRKDIVARLAPGVRHRLSEEFAVDLEEAIASRERRGGPPRREPEPAGPTQAEGAEKPDRLTDREVEDWLDVFGDDRERDQI